MEDMKSDVNTVSLQPFAHQVGGHSNFQQFNKYTVCKPLFSKELEFYQEIPSALKPFIPKFKGEFNFNSLQTGMFTYCMMQRNLYFNITMRVRGSLPLKGSLK